MVPLAGGLGIAVVCVSLFLGKYPLLYLQKTHKIRKRKNETETKSRCLR
jgi:hypothetical protein